MVIAPLFDVSALNQDLKSPLDLLRSLRDLSSVERGWTAEIVDWKKRLVQVAVDVGAEQHRRSIDCSKHDTDCSNQPSVLQLQSPLEELAAFLIPIQAVRDLC